MEYRSRSVAAASRPRPTDVSTVRLPDPDRSYAVLIDAGRDHGTNLPNRPAASNNVTALASALTNPDHGGFAANHHAVVSNPGNVCVTYRRLRESANLATDTLPVHFSGHGLLGPVKQDLYLALPDTDIGERGVSGRAAHDVMAPKTDTVPGQARSPAPTPWLRRRGTRFLWHRRENSSGGWSSK